MKIIKGHMEREAVEAEELKSNIGKTVKIYGSIYKIRKMSDFAFVLLRTKRELVQCVYLKEVSQCALEDLEEESCVRVTAYVKEEGRSKTGYDLQIENIEVLSSPQTHSPVVINNKCMEVSLEKLLDFRPITLRNQKERGIFKIQEGIVDGMRIYSL